jgi:WD40 repeat protein
MGLTLDPGASDSTAAVNEREGAGGFALLSGSTSQDLTQDTTRGKIKGGAFTVALIAGLDGGVVDPDGGVRFSSLARFVQQHVDTWKKSAEARTINATQKAVVRLEVADVQVVPPPRDHRDLTPAAAGAITQARFSPDGRTLVTGGADRTMRVWDALSCTPLAPPVVHESEVANVGFLGNGTEAVSVSRAGVTLVLPLAGGSVGETMAMDSRGTVHGVAWSKDGSRRAVATSTGLYFESIVDVNFFGATKRFGRVKDHRAVWHVPADRETVISGDAAGNVCGWTYDGVVGMKVKVARPVVALAMPETTAYVAIAGAGDPSVWNLANGEIAGQLRGHRGAVTGIACSPDGARIATACTDGLVRLFSSATGKLTRTLRLVPEGSKAAPAATAVCFTPKGDQLFVGYASGRGRRFQL